MVTGYIRTPNSGNTNNVYYVTPSGSSNNNNANNTYGVSPDCIQIPSPTKVKQQPVVRNQRDSIQGAFYHPLYQEGTSTEDAVRSKEQSQLYPSDLFYDKAISFKALYKSAIKCARGVRWKEGTQSYLRDILFRVHVLREELVSGKYKISKYSEFYIHEPKTRLIVSTKLRDRVFQKALCDNGLYKEITKHFIYDNCACQIGKGVDFALNRFKAHLHRYYKKHGTTGYYLKLDIQKYFPSIPHTVAKNAMAKYVKDPEVLRHINAIIDSFPDHRPSEEISKDTFGKRGIALGSQISQLVALALLNDLDHIIKEQMHQKYYVRYMDDLLLLSDSKEWLLKARSYIEIYLSKLGLKLNKRSALNKISNTIVFLKWRYRLLPNGRILMLPVTGVKRRRRLKIKKLFKKDLPIQKVFESNATWLAHMNKGNTSGIVKDIRNYTIGRMLMKIYTPEEYAAIDAANKANPAKRQRCTKYQLVLCLEKYYPELLETLKQAYAANLSLQFYWSSVLDLDRNNEDFKLAVQQLGITDEQLDDIFSKIEGEEPAAVQKES